MSRPFQKQGGEPITLYLSADVRERVMYLSNKWGVSRSAVVERLIAHHVGDEFLPLKPPTTPIEAAHASAAAVARKLKGPGR